MAEKSIMLACAAGMSTSLLVTRIQKAAEAKGLNYEIFAVPTSEAIDVTKKQKIHCVLLGPQVRFMEPEFKTQLDPAGIPVGVIPMQDYGMMNGEKVLAFAEKLMEN